MAGRTPAAPASREIASPGLAGFCRFSSLVLSPSPSPRACKRAVLPGELGQLRLGSGVGIRREWP